MRGVRFILLVFACVLPPTSAAQEPEQTDRNLEMVTIDVEALRAEIQQILDQDSIPGASVALVERDRTVWAAGIGKADVAARVDVTADHLFRIAYEDEPVASVFKVVDAEGDPILQLGRDGSFKKVARGWLLFQQGAAATTALLLISTVLFALVCVPAKLFGRMETLRLRAVVFPPLATLSIVVWFYLPAQYASTQALGNVSVWSLT